MGHAAVTPLAVAAERRPRGNRSISPAGGALSSKPAAAACGGRMMGRTDRQTNGRTPGSFIDPAPHTIRAVPITAFQCRNTKQPAQSNSLSLFLQLVDFPNSIFQ